MIIAQVWWHNKFDWNHYKFDIPSSQLKIRIAERSEINFKGKKKCIAYQAFKVNAIAIYLRKELARVFESCIYQTR